MSAAPPSGSRVLLFLSLEAARVERSWRMHLVALTSVPLAALAAWPGVVPELGRRIIWTAWLLAFGAAAWALVAEWRLERRVRRMP